VISPNQVLAVGHRRQVALVRVDKPILDRLGGLHHGCYFVTVYGTVSRHNQKQQGKF
jgi:hypothetical protein